MEELDVFLSWSKPASYQVAVALRDWLKDLLPSAKCWTSKDNIEKGRPWFKSIADQLAKSKIIIICVTPENVSSRWLAFEAGAVATKRDDSLICPFLFGVGTDALVGDPLSQYQATKNEKEDVWLLVKTLNDQHGQHDETVLRSAFDGKWPKLQRALNKIVIGSTPEPAKKPATPQTLSPEAMTILRESAKDQTGQIIIDEESDGMIFGPIMVNMDTPDYGKVTAKYRAAILELNRRKLIKNDDLSGKNFHITTEGYELAEKLLEGQPRTLSEADTIIELQTYVSKKFRNYSNTSITYSEVDADLRLPEGTAKRYLRTAAHKQGWDVETEGDTRAIFRHSRLSPRR